MDEGEAMARLVAKRVDDPRIIAAFRSVPRSRFVPADERGRSRDDVALPIGRGQTISQPSLVATMIDELHLADDAKVLEVGTGSGYAAALLCHVAGEVYTVERLPELADAARARLRGLGLDAHVRTGDGSIGWPEQAPFDAIMVSAGAPSIPTTLTSQLAPGGYLVVPVGPAGKQRLLAIRRDPDGTLQEKRVTDVAFVPLIGQEGHPS